MTGGAPLLSVEKLTRQFGALVAVGGISLDVFPEERRAIIGPNGAGKTTLFNLITGHIEASQGRIVFEGRPITGLSPHAVARRGISRSFQRTNLFPKLDVRENLRLAVAATEAGSYNVLGSGSARLNAQLDRAAQVAEAVGLAERLTMPAASLSYGEQRQLEVGVALATQPRLLLLDEPTAGMSPEETASQAALMQRLVAEQGLNILFTEHDMDVVFGIARWITVMHQGHVIADGKPEDVRIDRHVQAVYLGEDL